MNIKDEKHPLAMSLDNKVVRTPVFEDPTPSTSFNGRPFKKANSPHPKNRSNNYYYNRPWQYKFKNSMPARRFQCRDPSCHFNQWNMCCRARRYHFFDVMRNRLGNFANNSRKGNFNGNLRRAKSCESISSASNCGSNITRNSYNSQSNYNLNRSPITNNRRNQNRNQTPRCNKDPSRCPLDIQLQYKIRKLQKRFALTPDTPLCRINFSVQNCEPKQFDTGVKLTARIGNLYKPLEKNNYSF